MMPPPSFSGLNSHRSYADETIEDTLAARAARATNKGTRRGMYSRRWEALSGHEADVESTGTSGERGAPLHDARVESTGAYGDWGAYRRPG